MDSFTLTDYILEAYDLPKTLGKYDFTTYDLILCLSEFDTIKEVAKFLGTTDNTIEHIVERKIRPCFYNKKPRTKTWKAYFLYIFGLKACPRCGEIKDTFEFSVCVSKASGYMSWCKVCDGERVATYKENNPSRVKESSKRQYANNKAYYLAKTAAYRANKVLATPNWADLYKVKEIYMNCPDNMHVDHVYPLNSSWVCGLHNEFNLQYLSPEDNLKKSNKDIGQ
jgi:hypothetical protein